jgi:DNA-binding transcriptional ArsR family regulator
MARPARVDPFYAIADGTRRRLLDLLGNGEVAVSELAENFDMTLPAVSQHLRVLREAGLVTHRASGRQRLYRASPRPLSVVHAWTGRYERFWRRRLGTLGDYLKARAASHGRD